MKRVPPLKERAPEVIRLLTNRYNDAHCELDFTDAYQLLVAVILSAQCTDKRVNLVTPALFKAYPTVQDLAKASPRDVEKLIYTTGFYKNKTKHLLGMSRLVVKEYDGQIPDTMDALLTLPGVARKTANVLLGTWFQKNEGFVVDTHVLRITKRLGFTRKTNPVQVERAMMRLVPRHLWTKFAHVLVWHGRRTCFARNPACADCPVNKLCPSSRV